MIKKLTFSLCIFLATTSFVFSQTYVSPGATGANDGSSWEDAYTSLDSALANTTEGALWLSSGTYRHDGNGPDTFRTFLVSSPLSIYGGFAGTETSIDERDITANPTILSADFNNDDIEGNFDTLRSDNSYHVVTVDSLISAPVLFDGLTITGGHTGLNSSLSQYNRRGAGIYSWSTIRTNNCTFVNNFARAAGGIFLDPEKSGGSGSEITNCVFSGNYADQRGAGTYFFNQSDILIEGNTFTDNTTARGCVYPFRSDNIMIRNNKFTNNVGAYSNGFSVGVFSFISTNVTIDSCEFSGNQAGASTAIYFEGDSTISDLENNMLITNSTFSNNSATNGSGGVMFLWQAVGIRVESSTFEGNSASNLGGVVYQDGREQVIKEGNIVWKDCTFTNNESGNLGGAMSTWQSSTTIEDCELNGNSAAANGGAIYMSGNRGKIINVENTDFVENYSTARGNVSLRGQNSVFNFFNCNFRGNEVDTSGGAVLVGFQARVNLEDCFFTQNEANFGGSIFIQDSLSEVNVNNTDFISNTGRVSGGGIYAGFKSRLSLDSVNFEDNTADFGGAMIITSDSTVVDVNNSTFTSNIANNSGGAIRQNNGTIVRINGSVFTTNSSESGGAITAVEFNSDDMEGKQSINNSEFYFNSATVQGGALNIIGTDVDVTNCVIANNFNLNGISGGGISGNGRANADTCKINIINSTITDNEGPVGAGIGLWTAEENSAVLLNLQNTILSNLGANYQIEGGTPVVVSSGGNLSTDASLAGILSEELGDKEEVEDQIFVDADDLNFQLVDGSPAVDIGVEPAPATDILGKARVGAPDAGAYESDFSSSVKDILVENNNQLLVAPNPVGESVNIIMENSWKGEMKAQLFDIKGALVKSWNFVKSSDQQRQQVQVGGLQPGIYDLLIGNSEGVIVTRLVKL